MVVNCCYLLQRESYGTDYSVCSDLKFTKSA